MRRGLSPSAGAESPALIACRYINAGTSETFALLRHHGARILLRNLWRSPSPSKRCVVIERMVDYSCPTSGHHVRMLDTLGETWRAEEIC